METRKFSIIALSTYSVRNTPLPTFAYLPEFYFRPSSPSLLKECHLGFIFLVSPPKPHSQAYNTARLTCFNVARTEAGGVLIFLRTCK